MSRDTALSLAAQCYAGRQEGPLGRNATTFRRFGEQAARHVCTTRREVDRSHRPACAGQDRSFTDDDAASSRPSIVRPWPRSPARHLSRWPSSSALTWCGIVCRSMRRRRDLGALIDLSAIWSDPSNDWPVSLTRHDAFADLRVRRRDHGLDLRRGLGRAAAPARCFGTRRRQQARQTSSATAMPVSALIARAGSSVECAPAITPRLPDLLPPSRPAARGRDLRISNDDGTVMARRADRGFAQKHVLKRALGRSHRLSSVARVSSIERAADRFLVEDRHAGPGYAFRDSPSAPWSISPSCMAASATAVSMPTPAHRVDRRRLRHHSTIEIARSSKAS